MKLITTLVLLLVAIAACAQDSPRMATSLPPVAGNSLTAATQVQKVLADLPLWEDGNWRARLEYRELAAVKSDLAVCISPEPKSPAEFMAAVQRLSDDLDKLVALDKLIEIEGWA